jgi:hypothetical protein
MTEVALLSIANGRVKMFWELVFSKEQCPRFLKYVFKLEFPPRVANYTISANIICTDMLAFSWSK